MLTNLDVKVAIGDANLDDLLEYQALVAKEIQKRKTAIRKSRFDSFERACQQFLKDLSEDDLAHPIEISNSYCEDCYSPVSCCATVEQVLSALVAYLKK